MKNSHRQLWRPKFPEAPAQCASCPFGQGNDAEFGAVLNRLRKLHELPETTRRAAICIARLEVLTDLVHSGDFACHGTVYNSDMTMKPRSEWRQCKGATEHFRCSGGSSERRATEHGRSHPATPKRFAAASEAPLQGK